MINIETSTRAQIAEAWPAVAYKGDTNFFNNYLTIIGQVAEDVGCDNQECYLGYIPSKDRFIMGFDAWPEDEYDEEYDDYITNECNNVFSLTIRQDCAIQVSVEYVGTRMFYSSAHKELKELYPDLLDIRLD